MGWRILDARDCLIRTSLEHYRIRYLPDARNTGLLGPLLHPTSPSVRGGDLQSTKSEEA